MELNTNNLQTAFNYKPKSNEYVFNTISNTLTLNSDAIYLKYFEGEDLFCIDLGYSIDGDVSKMTFSINDLTVYPILLTTVDKLSEQDINEQEIYLISDDINFKSIIFIPKTHLNKTFKYTITSINTTFSSFMLDEIGRKFNSSSISTEASQVSQDNSNGLGDNVQVALDTLNNNIKELIKRYNIPLFVTVYPEDDGTFDDRKRPANYYKTLYNVTTVWKKRFADKSVFFRSQGSKSNVNRNNGLQPYGIPNLSGSIVNYGNLDTYSALDISGVFTKGLKFGNTAIPITDTVPNAVGQFIFNSQNQIRAYTNDIVVDNYEIEIYELESINGVNIWN